MTIEDAKQFKIDVSKGLIELGNLLLAGVIVSLVIDNREQSLFFAILGFILGVAPYLTSYMIRR